jgi:hypothetical protein
MTRRIIEETACPHDRWYSDCQLLLEDGSECPGGSRRELTIDYEAAAKAGYEATIVYQKGMVPEWEGATSYTQAQWRAWSKSAVDAALRGDSE